MAPAVTHWGCVELPRCRRTPERRAPALCHRPRRQAGRTPAAVLVGATARAAAGAVVIVVLKLRRLGFALAFLAAVLALTALFGNAPALVLGGLVATWAFRDRPWMVGGLVAAMAAGSSRRRCCSCGCSPRAASRRASGVSASARSRGWPSSWASGPSSCASGSSFDHPADGTRVPAQRLGMLTPIEFETRHQSATVA
jgi:hypothetical protein